MEPFHSKTGNKLIAIAIAVLWLVVLYLVLAVTRIDPEQQMAQKIFYYHVPSAWTILDSQAPSSERFFAPLS